MNTNNRKDQGINSSEAMGQFGNYPASTETKVFPAGRSFAVIEVKSGNCTIDAGKQEVDDMRGEYEIPDWDGLVLDVGVHIVNLIDLTVTTTGLTVCWYAAE